MGFLLQKYFWALSFLIMTGAAALAADGIGTYLVWKWDAPLAGAAAVAPGTAAERAVRAQDEFPQVVRGNLFNAKQRGSGAGDTRIPSAEDTATAVFHGQLVGTIVGFGAPSYAVIENGESHEQGLYRVGDALDAQTRVADVEREKVVLRRGSERIELVVVSAGATGESGGGGVRKIGENRWSVDPRAAQEALGDMNKLLTQAQILPAFSGGRPDGFRVASIVPGSFFDQIGFQNNDVLQRINGVEIRDPDSFIRVFAQLKDETRISVDLMRGGRKQTFQYDIH